MADATLSSEDEEIENPIETAVSVDYKAIVIKIRHAVLKIFEQLYKIFEQLLSNFLAYFLATF